MLYCTHLNSASSARNSFDSWSLSQLLSPLLSYL